MVLQIEEICNEVDDQRYVNFYIKKINKLYFYVFMVNQDILKKELNGIKCTI